MEQDADRREFLRSSMRKNWRVSVRNEDERKNSGVESVRERV